jgi:hypothetical protein
MRIGAIKKTQWDEAKKLILEEIDCGFFDGGCLILAEALKKILPRARVATILVRGRPDHYVVVLPDGQYADADGVAPDRETILKRYHKHEAWMEKFEDLTLEDRRIPNGITPRSTRISREIAEILKPKPRKR